MIDDGRVALRAELARALGASRARVAKMLQLLTLRPSVIDAILQLGDPLSAPAVSEGSLRPVVRMEHRKQKQWLNRVIGAENKTSEKSE